MGPTRCSFTCHISSSASERAEVLYRVVSTYQQNYRSEKGCIYGGKCHFRHVEAKEKSSKQSKKGGARGSVALLKECTQVGCAAQGSYPRKSVLREPGMLESKHAVKFKALGTKSRFGKKRVHREVLSRSLHLMNVVLAPQNSGKDHTRRPCIKKDAPAK